MKGIVENETRFEVVNEHLPKVVGEILNQYPNEKFESGVSKFMQEISDIFVDLPQTPEWFFKLVLAPLLDAARL